MPVAPEPAREGFSMTRTAFALSAVLLTAPIAFAQPIPGVAPAQRPTFSPYLNLLNRGGNPGLNYLGIVRPQQQLQQQFNQLQQQTNQQLQALGSAYDTQLDTLSSALLPPTGNVATFGNLGNYFGRIPTGSGVGGGGLGGGNRFGGTGGAVPNLQRPGFAGGGAGARPAVGGGGRR
jgi:hypothetical protein